MEWTERTKERLQQQEEEEGKKTEGSWLGWQQQHEAKQMIWFS